MTLRRTMGFLRPLVIGLGAAALILGAYEVWTPASVSWEAVDLSGIPAERARGLVVLDRRGGTTWASMGYAIYRAQAGGPFERVHSLTPPLGESWAGYSRTFRDRLRYQELVELMALSESVFLAFSGGVVSRVDVEAGTSEQVHTLRYFGRGKGRGLMPHGLARDAVGTIYYGEYPTGRTAPGATVRLYASDDEGQTWRVAHEFRPGVTRHIHAVQWDPHGQALWIATGDSDAESRIGYSGDGGRSFTWIGSGSQSFRAVSLMFLPDRVVWAMDAPSVDSHLLAWDRASQQVTRSDEALAAPGYFAGAVDGERGIVTLAERRADVLLVERDSQRTLLSWAVSPDPGRPHPSVRLLRAAQPERSNEFLVNPLRIDEAGATLYRVSLDAVSDLPDVAAPPPGTAR